MSPTRIATVWALLGGAGTRGISFVFFLLITRELAPSDVGTMALALALGVVLDAVIDLGLSDQVLRRSTHDQAEDQTFFGAVWVAQVATAGCLGLLLTAVVWAVGPMAASPEAGWAFAGVIGASFATALGLLPTTLLMRRMQYRFMALRNSVATVAGGGIGLWMARKAPGVDALVAMHVINACTSAMLAWWGSRWRWHRPAGSVALWRAVRPVSAQAGQTLATKMLEALVSRVDQVIIGSFFGPAVLGLYALALRLYDVLFQALCNPVAGVILTHLAGSRHDLLGFRERFSTVLRHAALFLAPVFVGAGLFLPRLLPDLFGAHWGPAGPFIEIVMAVGAVQAVGFTHCPAFTALGRQQANFGVTLASTVVWAVLLGSGLLTGAMSVVWLWAARALTGLLIQVLLMHRFTGQTLAGYWRASQPLWLSTAAVLLMQPAFSWLGGQHGWTPGTRLALSMVASALTFAVTAWVSSDLARQFLSARWRKLHPT